jgi:hypothetical protein
MDDVAIGKVIHVNKINRAIVSAVYFPAAAALQGALVGK